MKTEAERQEIFEQEFFSIIDRDLERRGVLNLYDGERQAIRLYYASKVLDTINISNRAGLDAEEALKSTINDTNGGKWYEF